MKKSNQHQFEYEFGGPIGAFLNIILLPICVLLFTELSANGDLSSTVEKLIAQDDESKTYLQNIFCPSCSDIATLCTCFSIIVFWFIYQIVLQQFLPADIVDGTLLRDDKTRLKYRINGHVTFWVTILTLPIMQHLDYGYDIYSELALVTIVLSCALSICLYTSSFCGNKLLAEPGNSGNIFYDFFMGRELNPRFGNFDWKEFCELRPGLLGWMLLNICMAMKQYKLHGAITGSMILINIFQGFYVWDALYNEKAILTTMDITTDGFGFMLVFGDLAWVPFMYSIQARYLVYNDPHLSMISLGGIVALHFFGYWIFRSANGQKNDFRSNPDASNLKHLKYLQTKRGTKLLVSGWWGWARKINYTGDWIMGLSWCLLCGVDSIVPYFYAIYFAILLVHRAIRDDHACEKKYGDDWEEYKKIVKYRFVPGLF